MDQTTHNVRRENWLNIIRRCQERPEGMTAKQWLIQNNINDKSYYYWLRKFRKEAYAEILSEKSSLPAESAGQTPVVTFAELPIAGFYGENEYPANHPDGTPSGFVPDAVIHTPNMVFEVSNSISPTLLSQLMEVMRHA